jgi:hypothetical protein
MNSSSIAIPLNTRILADLFSLDLKTPENKNGSLNTAELYKYLIDVRTFGFANNDPALSWPRRMWAREGAEALTKSTLKAVSSIPKDTPGSAKGIASSVTSSVTSAISGVASKIPYIGGWLGGKGSSPTQTKSGSLRWYGQNVAKELMAQGKTPAETADILWLTAVAGVGATIGLVRLQLLLC